VWSARTCIFQILSHTRWSSWAWNRTNGTAPTTPSASLARCCLITEFSHLLRASNASLFLLGDGGITTRASQILKSLSTPLHMISMEGPLRAATAAPALATQERTPLCTACESITLEQLCKGFEHPLAYKDAIESGKTCSFCRLMVCTFARLQVRGNAYEVDANYDFFVPELGSNKMVQQVQKLSSNANIPFQIMKKVPKYLTWERLQTMPGLCGCFNDGGTIQISAPEG
jgi:hypothetical protein